MFATVMRCRTKHCAISFHQPKAFKVYTTYIASRYAVY